MYCLQKMSGKNKCILDDIVNEFLEIAGDYDGFVFGTPVHWVVQAVQSHPLWTEYFMPI